LGVVEKAVFDAKRPAEMDESEIFVFGHVGDGGAQSTEVEGSDDTGGVTDVGVGSWPSCGCRGKVKLPVVGEIRPISSVAEVTPWFLTHTCRANVSWCTFAARIRRR